MTRLRSLLFVPADSEKKLAKALQSKADAVILDLEDSVALENKKIARDMASDWLKAQKDRGLAAYVRINPVSTPFWREDVSAIAESADGIMLPKSQSLRDVERIADALEEEGASADVRILPIVTETALSLFRFGTYAAGHPRLSGLTWGAEDLAADIGALNNKDEAGCYTGVYTLARTLTLAASAAAGVSAIDSVFTNFRDSEGLLAECRAARRDGFAGKMAIHPDQVDVINQAFTPDQQEIAYARSIIAAFAAQPGAGVVSLNGRMLDKPHLRQAEKILSVAGQA
jgi:citrate lyase subunit beta / citryl-CoA lyase